jgi:hypothetical protein
MHPILIRALAIDPPLDIDALFLSVLSAEKCLVDIFPLRRTWTLQEPNSAST